MSEQNEQVELDPIDSFTERRKVRESLKNERGVNIYGGERCECPNCHNVHWKRATNPEVEKE